MKNIALFLITVVALTGCRRRPIDDELRLTVNIPVKIDWSRSGINANNERSTPEVRRVSIRFFPHDGSPAFDRYLDTNVVEGTIGVPTGKYSVVAFNESIHDDSYWDGRIGFCDVDSYSGFAVGVRLVDPGLRNPRLSLQRLSGSGQIFATPLPLASWSIDLIEIAMNNPTQALTRIEMRALTRRLNVTAHIENLASACSMTCVQRGLAGTVHMASGRSEGYAAHPFPLNDRIYDPDGLNGTARASILCLGRTPSPESYALDMDVELISGEPHPDTGPMTFDVTRQVTASGDGHDINVRFDYSLPKVATGITVNDWQDREYRLE